MEQEKVEKSQEDRLKEIHSLTGEPGWAHVKEIFLNKVALYRDISSLSTVPAEELKKALDLNLEVASTLESVLREIENTAEQHVIQDVEPVRVYRSEDF